MDFLYQISTGLLVIIFILFFTVPAVILLLIVRNKFPETLLIGDQVKSANTVFTVIGSIYAILLALVLVTVWQNHQVQTQRTIQEACEIANLYRDARILSDKDEKNLQIKIREYVGILLKDGWPSMKNQEESPVAWNSFNSLYAEVLRFNPGNKKEEIIYADLVNKLNDLANYRRLRLAANEPGIPSFFWFLLVFGAYLTITFTCFFRTGSVTIHLMITFIHGTLIGMMLSLIFMLNHPYKGQIAISPSPLQKLLIEVFPSADKEKISFTR